MVSRHRLIERVFVPMPALEGGGPSCRGAALDALRVPPSFGTPTRPDRRPTTMATTQRRAKLPARDTS